MGSKYNQPKSMQYLNKREFSITFKSQITNKDIEFIDKSFQSIFEITPQKYLSSNCTDHNISLIQRFLLLSNVLHYFCGIPAFFIDKEPQYRIVNQNEILFSAFIPYLKYINRDMRISIYSAALHIIELLLKNNLNNLYKYLEEFHQNTLKHFRKINGQNDSTLPILEACYSTNIPFIQLTPKVFQLGWGTKSKLLQTSSIDEDSYIGTTIAHNKHYTKTLLAEIGCPIPKGFFIDNPNNLKHYVEKLTWPVIIKPIDLDRSEGVTTDINNYKDLEVAYKKAKKLSKNLMIEEHIQGDVYRIALIKDELLFVSKRRPKGIYGDGETSIEELIDDSNSQENKKAPWLRLKPFPKDQIAQECLLEQNFSLKTVLEKDQYAYLRKIQSNEEGGVAEGFTDTIHPENIKLAKKISNQFRLQSTGIDFISTDVTKPWYENGGKILEINFSPLVADRFAPWGNKTGKKFVHALFNNNCSRIPIDIYLGDKKAWNEAWKQYKKSNNTAITNHIESYYLNGQKEIIVCDSFYHRIQTLLCDSNLEHLIIVIQTDELFQSRIPFDQISNLFVVEKKLKDMKNNKFLDKVTIDQSIEYLSLYLE